MKIVKEFLIIILKSFVIYIAHIGLFTLVRMTIHIPLVALVESGGKIDKVITASIMIACMLIAPAILFRKFSPEKTNYILSIKGSEWKLKDDIILYSEKQNLLVGSAVYRDVDVFYHGSVSGYSDYQRFHPLNRRVGLG